MHPNKLQFLLSSSAENLIRLVVVLERRRSTSPGSEYDPIIQAMLRYCDEYKQAYLQHSKTINRLLAGDALSGPEEMGIKVLLRNCINTFVVLHELLLFLPRESIRKEMHFFLRSLFGEAYDPKDLSVILTSIYNAFEYSLDSAITLLDVFVTKIPDPKQLQFGHVMELAIVDRDNPLSWGILAHEFGHYIDQKQNISAPLATDFVKKKINPPATAASNIEKLFKNLASEIFADITAYYLLGPVSLLPVVNMELNLGMATDMPPSFDSVHPFTTTRATFINDVAINEGMSLDLFGPFIETLRADDQEKLAKLDKPATEQRLQIDAYIRFFVNDIMDQILRSLGQLKLVRFDKFNLSIANQLKDRLLAKIPIGSRPAHSIDEVSASIAGLSLNPSVDDARRVFSLLREEPALVSEVIAAGWIAKSQNKLRFFREAFGQKEEKIFPYLQAGIEDEDRLLMKSVEMISVTRD
ncbi:MAG: hypothetical protein LAP39_02685 [Acidobacteriia bacterium]|nr:hypothetical protein [Terriglobia bacterium]